MSFNLAFGPTSFVCVRADKKDFSKNEAEQKQFYGHQRQQNYQKTRDERTKADKKGREPDRRCGRISKESAVCSNGNQVYFLKMPIIQRTECTLVLDDVIIVRRLGRKAQSFMRARSLTDGVCALAKNRLFAQNQTGFVSGRCPRKACLYWMTSSNTSIQVDWTSSIVSHRECRI